MRIRRIGSEGWDVCVIVIRICKCMAGWREAQLLAIQILMIMLVALHGTSEVREMAGHSARTRIKSTGECVQG